MITAALVCKWKLTVECHWSRSWLLYEGLGLSQFNGLYHYN